MTVFFKRFISLLLIFTGIAFVILWGTHLNDELMTVIDWPFLIMLLGVFSLLGTLIMMWQDRQLHNQLKLFIEKLNDLNTNNTNPGHILLRPEDPLFPLAEAVNDAQRYNRDRIKLLQQQESALSTLMDNMPLGAMQIDPDRVVTKLNMRASKMLGIPLQVVGKHYDDVVMQHNILTLLEKGLHDKQPIHDRIKLFIDDEWRTFDMSLIYYQTRNNHYALLALFYDITDLTQLQDMQSTFVANASHELRTPLTAVSGFVETLLTGAQDDPKARTEFLMIIQKETQRLLDLTEDILKLAKKPTQHITDVKAIQVSQLIDAILQGQRIQKDRLHLTFENNINDSITLYENEDVLRQILINLIENAVKYNKDGGLVRITTMKSASYFMIAVKDTGMGISSDAQQHIFERFYRVDKSRHKKIPGTGLGLAIVQELLAKVQGQIEVDSQVGVGTTVTISLPLKNH